MNVTQNQHNVYTKKPNDDTNVITDAIINKLLEKYDLNKAAKTARKNNIPVNNNKSENNNVFGMERTSDPSKTPETFLRPSIGDILQRYSMNYDDNEKNTDHDSEENYSDLMNNIEENSLIYDNAFKNHFENKRNLAANLAFLKSKVVTFRNDKNETNNETKQNSEFYSNKSYAEKTTYCRPVSNDTYNQEFIYKTLDRNAKLQALLKKLILARRKEKEKEQWNNYVNELKNKHNYPSTRPKHIVPQYVPQDRFYVESNDIYKINQTEPCKHPRNDYYAYANAPFHEYYPPKREMVGEGSGYGYLYENELYCYPTASQGRVMMLKNQRTRRNLDMSNRNLPPYRSIYPRPQLVFVDKEPNCCMEDVMTEPDECIASGRASPTPTLCKCASAEIKPIINKNTPCHCAVHDDAVQTQKSETCCKVDETTKEKYDRVTENVNRLKAQIESNEQKVHRQNSLWKIESKLDVLIKSMKNLMADLKIKSSCSRQSSMSSVNVNKPETDKRQGSASGSPKREQSKVRKCGTMFVGHVETNTSTNAFQASPNKLRHFQPTTKIDNILCEELHKSNKLRKELGELLHTRSQQHHSVQITVDIPTRERATEVTDSLSRTVLFDKEIEEVGSSFDVQDSQITMAVNTDPLGLLTLLTMSTDVVKQLISYVPTVDYGWYLSRLPLPHLSGRNVADFVCNICGAAFARPSQLSDHMKCHDLGNTKDCCVCRHVLDLKRRPPGLFACRYCGQRFTRAYCCELHEQSCARALGFQHDVASSLALLR